MDTEKTWPMKTNADFSNDYMDQKHKDNSLYIRRKMLSFFVKLSCVLSEVSSYHGAKNQH